MSPTALRSSVRLVVALALNLLALSLLAVRSAAGQGRVAIVTASQETNPVTEVDRAVRRLGDGTRADCLVGAEHLPRSAEAWKAWDVVLFDVASDSTRSLRPFIDAARTATRVIVLGDSTTSGTIPLARHPWIAAYWANASVENFASLFRYLAVRVTAGDTITSLRPPQIYPTRAFYHPRAPHLFASLDEYLTWYREAPGVHYDPTRPNIGLLFNMGVYRSGVQQAMDSLIVEIERKGANAFALPADGAARFADAFVHDGTPIIDALIFHGERLNLKSYDAGVAEAKTLDRPIISALVHFRQSPTALASAPTTLSPDLTAFAVQGERDGVMEPLVVAGRSSDSSLVGIPLVMTDQVSWRVDRALAWTRLHRAANRDKRIVFTFWSEAAGKSDVGGDPDDFLDVPGSLERLLHALRDRGYQVGADSLPDRATIARWLSRDISNVGPWAPAELSDRVARGQVTLIPESTYVAWFATLPAQRQREIVDVWGPPPGKVMVYTDARGRRSIAIPRMQLGNVLLAPHPAWGYQLDDRVLMSDGMVPPHHEYLAFFLWLQREWRADAWVSLFTNIVLQPGKGEGPLASDHIAPLLGTLPHIHPERLGAGGGVSNVRKGLAGLVSWYNIVAPAGAGVTVNDLRSRATRLLAIRDTAVLNTAIRTLRGTIDSLGLTDAMSLDATMPPDVLARRVVQYADNLDRAVTPWGSKVLGDAPRDTVLADMVHGMLATDIPRRLVRERLLASGADAPMSTDHARTDSLLALASVYADGLRAAPREVDRLLDALEGRYIESGPAEEPLRRPDAVPPGRSMYTFDPRTLPTPEAEVLGARLADDMIRTHREKHDGAYPTRFAFVLWAGEVTKNLGVVESQVFRLLGVRPVRDAHGEVVDVSLVPREELGRPRVDVMVVPSGVYRDHFARTIDLMARAIRLAEASPEADNAVAHTTRAALAAADSLQADSTTLRALASARVFTSAPNAYGPSISFLARIGDLRGDDKAMADVFTRQMSFAYGGSLAGATARSMFELQLKSLDGATLSRSGAVNALLDNPAPASFLGGINLATRAVRGTGTDLFVTNVVDTAGARMQTLREALRTELDSRYFNPQWIREMQAHGYDGARNVMFMTENLDLWNTTSTDAVRSADWEKIHQVYVKDEYGLDMDAFFDGTNPYAHQVLMVNLLEAAKRGMWSASRSQLEGLASRLARSVNAHGNSCDAILCRNEGLTGMLDTLLAAVPDGATLRAQYRASLDAVRGAAPGSPVNAAPSGAAPSSVAPSAAAPSSAPKASRTPSASGNAAPPAPSPTTPALPLVQGRLMQEVTPDRPVAGHAPNRLLLGATIGFILLLTGAGWMQARREDHGH